MTGKGRAATLEAILKPGTADNMDALPPGRPGGAPGLTRAILTGLALIPFNIYFLLYMEVGFNQGWPGSAAGPYPSTISLFANCVFFLAIISGVNCLLERMLPRFALSRAEILVVYVMLTISTAIVSIDYLDVLVPMITFPFRGATNENDRARILWPHIPWWLSVRDPEAVRGWYEGHGSLYEWGILRWWLVPVAAWPALILTMLFVMFCINTIVRQRWIEHDRLQFPIVELPMQMTEPGHRLFHSRLMWTGFALAGGISIINGLHGYFSLVPLINTRMWDASRLFVNKPWNAIGTTPVSFYPYAIGLGFLLPLDMLFSCWFFFLMWRVVRMLGSMYGAYDTTPDFPFMNHQALGAYLLIGLFAVWSGRGHLGGVLRAAVSRGERQDGEPMSYRTAVFGLALGTAAVTGFFHAAGMRWWVAAAAVGLYFFLALAIARMHAEFGPPAHDLHLIGPEVVLTDVLGSRSFSHGELAGLSWFWWFNRAYRSIPIAYQLDGLKLAQRTGTPNRQMAAAIAAASVAAVFCGFWFYLHFGYVRGAEVGMPGHVRHFGVEGFVHHFDTWITSPRDASVPKSAAIALGMAIAYLLYLAKLGLPWWPLHPLGFAVSTIYSIGTLWLPLLIAWAAKIITLKTGGLRSYRVALDFFLGLLLGDFIVGCLWPLAGLVLRIPTYSFMQ